MGFDPTKIGSDERAKRVFGEKEVFRIDELLNKPRLTIKKGDYSAKGEIVGRAWVFEVKAKVPTGRGNEVRDERVGHGSIMLQPSSTEPGKWVPEHGSTLDFTLDNRVVVGGRQWRLKFEGAEQLTDYVLKESITQFTKQTGAAPELGGSLAWDNKLQFCDAPGICPVSRVSVRIAVSVLP